MKTWILAAMAGCMIVMDATAKDSKFVTVQITELDAMVKFTRNDKSVEYKMMTFAEYQELQKQYQRSAALYPKAIQMAAKAWRDDASHAGRPFPVARLSPEKVDLVDRMRPSERLKPGKENKVDNMIVTLPPGATGDSYVMPKKWESLLEKNGPAREPKTEMEKKAKADLDEAVLLVTAKLNELEGATPPAGNNAPAGKVDAPPAPDPGDAPAQ